MKRRATVGLIGAALPLMVALAACGDDDGGDTAATTATTAASATTATDAGAGGSNAVTITERDFSFEVDGHPHPGLVDVTVENAGPSYHMIELAPLKDGVTDDQVHTAAGQGEDALMGLLAGDPDESGITGLPGVIAPGQTAETVTEIPAAGKYIMLCFVPGANGMPHMMQGMIGTLDVEGDEAGTAPETDGTITLTDTGIDLPDAATSGHGWFEVTNTGTAPHTIGVADLPDGTTLDAVYQWITEHFAQNQPLEGGPGDLVTGLNLVPPGGTAYLRLDLDPGHYGYASSEGQPPDDDYTKGLQGEFDVR